MKRRKIATKLLGTIIPVIVVSMIIFTLISSSSSKSIINNQIEERMAAELSAQEGAMAEYLENVSTMATSISNVVATTYETIDMPTYEKMLGEIIQDNDIVLGSGLWFEPYVYDKNEKYMGPYVYKDGGELVTTYDYSNADYDYFNQEYYINAMETDQATFTNPYYDETSGTIMSSCSVPIIVDGKKIGCVTVDIELSTVTALVEKIKVGTTGKGMMLDGTGVYMAGVDAEKITNEENITQDSNSSLAKAGKNMLEKEKGITQVSMDGNKYNVYFRTLSATGWKLAISMTQKELSSPVIKLAKRLILLAIICIAIVTLIIILEVRSIAKGIATVEKFAGNLAVGDFTIEPISVKTKDEVGAMGESLNNMYGNNKKIIQNISEHAQEIDRDSESLRDASAELTTKFNEIKRYMTDVNEAMMTTSAATEEVNASTEEVLSNVSLLANETADSTEMAQEIRARAAEVGENSRKAYDSATQLGKKFEKNLEKSIENAKIVASISELANVISGIAEEINLLSLNASIEAARAGDAGRGFAVVASEIGQLAGNTGEAVGKIQETISEVQRAFDTLSKDATEMLNFLTNEVTPDYQNFVTVANQYGLDAESIDTSSSKISEMAENIKYIIDEVTSAIQNIADATQETTDVSGNILSGIEEVSGYVSNVSNMSEKQQEVAEDLNSVVSQFKL